MVCRDEMVRWCSNNTKAAALIAPILQRHRVIRRNALFAGRRRGCGFPRRHRDQPGFALVGEITESGPVRRTARAAMTWYNASCTPLPGNAHRVNLGASFVLCTRGSGD